jgi:DNA excision repair protein ERCC-2
MDLLKQINFPYSSVRKGQDRFIFTVYNSLKKGKNSLISAPTGLGKTVSALAPAIAYAKEKDMTVIVLTSRQTQANQIIKTIKDISEKSKEPINFLAFSGKRNMCVHSKKDLYSSQDFNSFCEKQCKTKKCKYYLNVKNSEYENRVKSVLEETSGSFLSIENFINLAYVNELCPYELANKKAYKADVVVCDYNYMFSWIRKGFLGKIGRTLDECILVVDEAHNLPDRIRNSNTFTLDTDTIKKAFDELKDFVQTKDYDDYILNLRRVIDEFEINFLSDIDNTLIEKEKVLDKYISMLPKGYSFSDVVEKLEDIEVLVKEQRIVSYIGRFVNFLKIFEELNENSFIRTIERKKSTKKNQKDVVSLKISCIDPFEFSSEVINTVWASVIMSATLSPIQMYKDLLGVSNSELLELDSPFEKKNQLTLVVDDVTTKYSQRSSVMYKRIANHIESILNSGCDKNAIVFFPSYVLMENILDYINELKLDRQILKELRFMTKEEKESYVEKFKSTSNSFDSRSKVLFAVTSGSFSEGLDLPSTALEMVLVVGLPLGVPDVKTKAIITHFDRKFKRGQMYGYINPAMNKIIQAAGRCIRTDEDKGVVVLLDNRFMWPMYGGCFPRNYKLKRCQNPQIEIGNFFNKN